VKLSSKDKGDNHELIDIAINRRNLEYLVPEKLFKISLKSKIKRWRYSPVGEHLPSKYKAQHHKPSKQTKTNPKIIIKFGHSRL
jgi:hypothetical protein